jgi:hypothetical protein
MHSTPRSTPSDFTVVSHGSVVSFTATTTAAQRWAVSELGLADWQWLGTHTFAVEHRIAADLQSAIEESGWVVR